MLPLTLIPLRHPVLQAIELDTSKVTTRLLQTALETKFDVAAITMGTFTTPNLPAFTFSTGPGDETGVPTKKPTVDVYTYSTAVGTVAEMSALADTCYSRGGTYIGSITDAGLTTSSELDLHLLGSGTLVTPAETGNPATTNTFQITGFRDEIDDGNFPGFAYSDSDASDAIRVGVVRLCFRASLLADSPTISGETGIDDIANYQVRIPFTRNTHAMIAPSLSVLSSSNT